MSRKAKIWLIASAIFLVFVMVVWFVAAALHLASPDIWVFRAGLWVLGAVAAGFVVWYLLRQLAPQTAPGTRTDDIDAAMNAARAQLAAARAGGKGAGSLARSPMVILLGAEGSAKTTTIVRSGLEPELMAGGVSRDDTVAPTKGVNVWYARDTVFVEAGGPLAADPARFARLIRHVQPRRLAAVFGGGAQAPRLAMVCVSCDHLVQPGASEQAVALGRMLRDRLSELSRGLGIRLPVYVLFTKADRIAYFADYVRNFSNDEAREVVGVTLPADVGAVGLYADRQSKRIADSFQRLFVSLADKRLQVLGREAAVEPKPGAYEFPRELRKTGAVITQFLVELCRPSQLQVSPFLRGYYFAGVRPVFINDAAPAAAAAAMQSRGEARSATSVFRAEQMAAQTRAVAAAPTRKVPQWVFLGRLFTDVVLGDRAAMNVTRGGARVNTLRRVALGLATAAGVVLALGFTVSWSGNRKLAGDTAAEARAAMGLTPTGTTAPPVESLHRLDTLRTQLQMLRDYERNGAPARLRWGLYTGGALLPDARRAYFASYDKLLFEDTRGALVSALRAVPPAPRPTDDYGSTYRVLKAYLITTTNPERSTEDFLAPVLLTQWTGVRAPDTAQSLLAQRQFAFYARELPLGDPFSVPADSALVGRARSFLRQFTGIEPIYQAMLAEADSGHAAIQFNKMVPGSAAYVVDRVTVRGAFTKPGYAAMQKALGSADRFFQGERWVLGDEPPSQVDKTKALADLRARYESDYIAAWRDYLQGASVTRYGNVSDAAAKLAQLSGNQSPLLSLISIASQNTNADTAIGNAFQPAHVVVPPGQTDKLIGQSVQAYMSALLTLQGSLGQVATAPPGQSEGAIANATQNANAARGEAQKLAQGFVVGREPAVATAVQRLLTEPLASIDPYLRNYGAGQVNGKGQSFCAKTAGLFAKYPFNDHSPIQASLDEVTTVFKPGTGALWTYYNDALQNVIQPQGSTFAPKSGGTLSVNPEFLSFFNRAVQFSAAIFPAGSNEARLTLNLTNYLMPQSGRLRVVGDGLTVDYAAAVKPHQFTWTFQPSSEATIAVEQGNNIWTNVASFHGTWAVFQLFGAAASWEPTATDYRAEWSIPGNTAGAKVGLDVGLNNVPPVLRRGFFSGFSCVSRVVQ